MDTFNHLIRLKTYADRHGVSVTTVNNWNKSGEIFVEKIDGIKFVNLIKSKKENGNKKD